ncbi:hypothetical protein GH811_18105 [Acetobacterium malicum]|uniref:Uncharacterized protein n=1 Tax=Acetobacterium malicum TaxID=52692 RepID=A0ABR6Z2N6_9FIRM|nr:hypothetical protein [Acetobacterium malicum]MBC3901515.1 hypothetical protein [Acetobacterium malicum]
MEIFKRIYNYRPLSRNRKEGFEVESDQFIGLRYIIKGDSLVITSAKNGAFAVDLEKGKLLAQEIMEMVEYYEK